VAESVPSFIDKEAPRLWRTAKQKPTERDIHYV